MKRKKLSQKQELFCKLYATKREYIGNGLRAYAKAYNTELSSKRGADTAKAGAHRLLTKDYISQRINELLEKQGLYSFEVDIELAKMIMQNDNFSIKLGAIKEYNRLTKRSLEIPEVVTVDLATVTKELKKMSIEELQRETGG